eukprot:gene8553-5999_t
MLRMIVCAKRPNAPCCFYCFLHSFHLFLCLAVALTHDIIAAKGPGRNEIRVKRNKFGTSLYATLSIMNTSSVLRRSSVFSTHTHGMRSVTSMATGTTAPSIREALSNSELELYPLRGEFINYDVDTTYVMAFTVRNRSSTTQTIRFFPPQKAANAFRLVNHSAVRLAPGRSRVIDVEFSTHTVEDYQDTFVILTERGARVEVPIIAQSAPALELDSVIDFGVVEHNRTSLALPFNLKNRGRREALVTFVIPPEASTLLTVNPSAILAKSLRDTKVSVELAGLSIGKFDWPVEVQIEGEPTSRKLHVKVEVIDCRSRLLDLKTGEEAVSVLFNKVYAGAKEAHELLMINGSEVGVSFAFQLANELVAKEAPPFRFHPEQGTLGPKERRKVQVVFEPPMNYVRQGWSNSATAAAFRLANNGNETKKFEGLFSLLFVETEETHSFHVVGESTETQVSLSNTVVDFGECALNDYRNEIIEVRNDVEELPMSFSFDGVAHFRVEPQSGVVSPGGTIRVTITFQPHKPGKFSEKLKVMFNRSVRRAVTVIGHAVVDPKCKRKLIGGPNAVPEDFKRPLKLPDKPRPTDRAVSEENALQMKSKVTPADLGLPPADDAPMPSHHVQQKELREEDEAIHSPSTHVAPMTFDVKSLIRRRFNEMPDNAVERRDCRRELLPMDLLKVVAPIKSLQFERITVGTCATRPYYLFNGTNACILVTMPPEDLYPELEFSPHSQVIPPSRMAAFDVSLCSSKIQSLQQVVNFSVNHHHPMRVSVHAEIVPVEVVLPFEEVTLNFSEFTDEPITKTTITLTNNGNCDAAFWWKLPPKAPFTIHPAEGVIPPMSKPTAQITFTPPQGVLSCTCDAYLAVEGASEDKKLRLRGEVEATNCSWAKLLVKATGEAQIDLRRIPAGQESSTSIYITNHGSTNAFYSFDALPPWLIISPARGRISAGEMEDLQLTVKMDHVENISQMINCHIRGMRRPLRMHLTANVVAPPMSVVRVPTGSSPSPQNFDKSSELLLNYGEIYIGYEKRLAVRVKNSGDVPGVMLIDLSDNRDVRVGWKSSPLPPGSNSAVGEWDPLTGGLGGPPVLFPDLDMDTDRAALAVDTARPASARHRENPDASAPVTGRSSPSGPVTPPGTYLITVEPNTEEVLYFCYKPSTEIPLSSAASSSAAASPTYGGVGRKQRYQVLWRQIGADDALHALPQLVLAAVPLQPKVEMTKQILRFPSMVTGRAPKPQMFAVKNLCLETLRWGIHGSPEEAASHTEHFLVEPMKGSIPPNGSITINVSFLGSEVGNFRGVFQLFVDEAPHKPCGTVVCYAKATKPRIFSDKKQIIFPAVPLGVSIRDVIHVTNDGFESIQLRYNEESSGIITVAFPRGDILSNLVGRLPVEIVFSPPTNISINSSLTITTDKGETIELQICAVGINSILTTCPFVQYREHFSTIGEGQLLTAPDSQRGGAKDGYSNVSSFSITPFVYRETKPNTIVTVNVHDKGSALRFGPMAPYETLDALNRTIFNSTALDVLTRWFNIMLLRTPVESIIDAMQQSHGGILYDIIARLSGRRPTLVNLKAAMIGNSGSTPAPPVPQFRLKGEQMIYTLFTFLKLYGCCVHHVHTKFLLTYGEYCEVIAKTEQPLSFEAFSERMRHSWATVLLETVRVFFLSKFTLNSLIQLSKPMDNLYLSVDYWESHMTPLREAVHLSNVYSAPESLLLLWVRSCVEKYCKKEGSPFAAAQKIRVMSFADMKDTRSLIAVVLVYCPALHPFFFSGEKAVVLNPTSAADHDANATILLNAMTELAIPQLPTSRVLLEVSQMNLVLFTSILYSYLPKFMSREIVQFEGKLLSPITRTIDVKNTSSKTRLYRVWIENSLFTPSKKELAVPAGGTVPLDIVFMPRYNRVVKGRCLLVDQSAVPLEDHVPLVFGLRAAPNMEPTKIFEIQTNLYEPLVQDIMVENPFEQDCVVSVRISQEGSNGTSSYPSSPFLTRMASAFETHAGAEAHGPGNVDGSLTSKAHSVLSEAQAEVPAAGPAAPSSTKNNSHVDTNNPTTSSRGMPKEGSFISSYSNAPFFVYTDVLPLRKGENAKLPIQFIPLSRGLYVLKITFRDEREGEFSYVVEGTCKDPKPSDTLDFRTELEESCTVSLTVRGTNNAVERAVRLFEEKCRQIHREIPPVVLDWTNNVYHVEFLNDKMEGPNPFFSPAAEGATTLKMEGMNSTYQFQFNPKMAGTYPGAVRLTSAIDVRVVRLNGECVPRGQRQILRFHCPARQTINQDITITNLSDQDWLITATIEGESFTGAKELRVPRGKRKEYSIKYSPHWITENKEDTGRLILLNSGTGQKHTYTLQGEADAPLSEDTIRVECRAREHQSVVLTIPNVARHDCTYYIETDLPFTEGETSIIIPRDSFARYTLNFFPAVGGTYVGKVIFKSHQGLYVWFIVNVMVTPPEKEGSVIMKTDVRTSVVADVTMRNPMNKPMNFFVRRFGAGLYGENIFVIEPQSAAVYNCIFVPTHAGEMEGRLSFCNDEVGEFWYELKMIVEESAPEELKFSSPLGVSSSARVKLTNTSDQECALQVLNTNPRNFTVSPTLLVIPPNKDLHVDVTYVPTCVGDPQEGSLTLSHHQLGQWQYSLVGTGIEPEKNKLTTCVCEMGSNTALSLPFTNTLDVETRMLFSFSENEARNFSIRRAPDTPIAPGSSGVVVVVYAPHAVGQHTTTLEIRPEVGLTRPRYSVCWSFPIEANAEWRETTTPFRFRCPARKNHEEVITLPAPGLTAEDKECATIRFEPDPNQHYLSAVHASFLCNLVQDNPMPDAFKATIRFTPLRSMAASGDLLVRGANGGSWRYRVYLEASPAPLDDTIQMKSAYKTTSSVSFDLYNVFSYKSKFAAYLTSESSKDFTVVPTHGVLLPFTRGQKSTAAATTLRINFTPTTRVPQVEGVLVVDTEDMQWSFKVVGRLDNDKGNLESVGSGECHGNVHTMKAVSNNSLKWPQEDDVLLKARWFLWLFMSCLRIRVYVSPCSCPLRGAVLMTAALPLRSDLRRLPREVIAVSASRLASAVCCLAHFLLREHPHPLVVPRGAAPLGGMCHLSGECAGCGRSAAGVGGALFFGAHRVWCLGAPKYLVIVSIHRPDVIVYISEIHSYITTKTFFAMTNIGVAPSSSPPTQIHHYIYIYIYNSPLKPVASCDLLETVRMTQLNSAATPFMAPGRSALSMQQQQFAQADAGAAAVNPVYRMINYAQQQFGMAGGSAANAGALLDQQMLAVAGNTSGFLAPQPHNPSFHSGAGSGIGSPPPSPLPSAYVPTSTAGYPQHSNLVYKQHLSMTSLQQIQHQMLQSHHPAAGTVSAPNASPASLVALRHPPSTPAVARDGNAPLPSLSQSPMIRDVWAQNLEEEFAVIRSLISDYPYVAMDTEFPGEVAKPAALIKVRTEYYYRTLSVNVNMLKMIQLGMTLLNERGEVPEHCSTWQFNFSFNIQKDTYATDSIQLLMQGGIMFDYFEAYGIDVNHFASLLISSGLVRNPEVKWLTFHAGYDFAYLTRALFNAELPEQEEEFLRSFHMLFPYAFDLKYLLRQTDYSHSSGLDCLASSLKVKRFGSAHQAGSDSLLTGHCYFKLLREYFKNAEPKHGNGILYGLTEDTSRAYAAHGGGRRPSQITEPVSMAFNFQRNNNRCRQPLVRSEVSPVVSTYSVSIFVNTQWKPFDVAVRLYGLEPRPVLKRSTLKILYFKNAALHIIVKHDHAIPPFGEGTYLPWSNIFFLVRDSDSIVMTQPSASTAPAENTEVSLWPNPVDHFRPNLKALTLYSDQQYVVDAWLHKKAKWLAPWYMPWLSPLYVGLTWYSQRLRNLALIENRMNYKPYKYRRNDEDKTNPY